MSQTYSIVCDETRTKLWIGQGWGGLNVLYSGSDSLVRLRQFLDGTRGKALRVVCSDTEPDPSPIDDYAEFTGEP